jgi:hypothetical protein
MTGFDRTGRLNLELLGNKRLKWLIPLGLMILNSAATKAGDLAATSARNVLTAGFKALVDSGGRFRGRSRRAPQHARD